MFKQTGGVNFYRCAIHLEVYLFFKNHIFKAYPKTTHLFIDKVVRPLLHNNNNRRLNVLLKV